MINISKIVLHENKLRPLTDTILDHIKKSSHTISKVIFFKRIIQKSNNKKESHFIS